MPTPTAPRTDHAPVARGTLFVVSAPSGAGKTSLVRALLEHDRQIKLSTSYTTRAPRPGEVDGEHYHFVDHARFEQMIAAGELVEYARVFDNAYGTAEATLREVVDAGSDLLLEIDWQGARQVRQRLPEAVNIFILPPSLAALESRLRGRAQDSDTVIARRMAQARDEVSHFDEYDYLIVNDRFETALAQLGAVVLAERLRLATQRQRHRGMLAELLAERGD